MKKTLSVFLAILMTVFSLVPAFAAEGDEAVTPDAGDETVKYEVSFQAPVELEEDAYIYVKSVDGEIQYQPDENGKYVFFDGRYMLPSNIIHPEDIPAERFSPIEYKGTIEVSEGETIAFRIMTSEKYNVYTATVLVENAVINKNAKEEYAVYVDRNLSIRVAEFDDNYEEALLRNHFNVKLTSGDGYKVKTLKHENYEVTYYGDSFRFRVHVAKGYSAAGMKVSVYRGNAVLGGFLDEEDSDMLLGVMGGTEALTSYGVDEDGCRLYEITNVTTDCKIIVSGVQEESTADIMSLLKRILRLILNFLGIEVDFLDSLTAYYTVSIDAAQADNVTYTVLRSSSDELSPKEFTVTGGDGVTIVVTKKNEAQDVRVMWTPGNETATYDTVWTTEFNAVTGEVTYSAVYNIDNITADTKIVIS